MEDLIVEECIPDEAELLPDVEALLGDLWASDINRRMLAARAFSEVQEERAIPALIHLLQDECPLVRVSSAYALGRNPCPKIVEPLIAALRRDWNGYVRKGLIWALGNCCDSRAFEPLVDSLATDIPAVRLWSASALGQLGDVRAVPYLSAALLSDPLAVVRSNCAWALGRLECTEAIPSLVKALKDEDLSVQQDVHEALESLGYNELEGDGVDVFEIPGT
jgi:HEAT repeat protein